MARRRYISTQISLDECVDTLAKEHGDFAALLYTWMVPHAEDDGTMTGDPGEILYSVMPRRRDKCEADIERALLAMHELGLILWDRENRRIYFPCESFYRYQTYIKKEKRRTADPTDLPDPTPQNTDEHRRTPKNAVSPSPSPTPSPSLSHPSDEGRTAPRGAARQSTRNGSRRKLSDSNSPGQRSLAYFGQRFEQQFGKPPRFNFGKDGSLAKDLCEQYGEDEVRRLIDLFFETDDEFVRNVGGYTFGVFVATVNKLISVSRSAADDWDQIAADLAADERARAP